jgi:hypothetical protein
MNPLTASHAEHELTQLAARFAHWRQNRTSLTEPIPDALWEQAVSLTAVFSISHVAKQLRLSGRDLKKRCPASPSAAPPAEGPSVPWHFVELPPPPTRPMHTHKVEVDLQRADGARLHLNTDAADLPLEALVKTFLETRPWSS